MRKSCVKKNDKITCLRRQADKNTNHYSLFTTRYAKVMRINAMRR